MLPRQRPIVLVHRVEVVERHRRGFVQDQAEP